MKGIDANQDVSLKAACIKKKGFEFVCRYYKPSNNRLTYKEAQLLSAAGLFVVSVVERGYPVSPGYFSSSKGVEDALFALEMAAMVGQPEGSPIYFAVDYDAPLHDVQGPIHSYFIGVNTGLKGNHPIGVYGSGLTCGYLLKHTPVAFSWLAMATGWTESRTFTGWNIKQHVMPGPVCGVPVDWDETNGHGGGWRI